MRKHERTHYHGIAVERGAIRAWCVASSVKAWEASALGFDSPALRSSGATVLTSNPSKIMDAAETFAEERPNRALLARWGGHPAVFAEGFVGVPTSFLKYFSSLTPALTPSEALFVLELMVYKWGSKAPFPGYKSLASHMGVSETYARKIARSLEKKGYLKREIRVGTTNRFDLQPLFDQLDRFAQQMQARSRSERSGFGGSFSPR